MCICFHISIYLYVYVGPVLEREIFQSANGATMLSLRSEQIERQDRKTGRQNSTWILDRPIKQKLLILTVDFHF